MGKGKVVSSEQIKKSDRDTYWVEVDGSPVAKVPLRRSREVALEPRSRRLKRPNHGERHKVQSARLNPESDGITDSEFRFTVYGFVSSNSHWNLRILV